MSTPVFEGPFDVLLRLVSSERVDLWEVSVLRIVDDFIAYCEEMAAVDLELSTEFLLLAAALVELKCRRLLPSEEDPDLDEDMLSAPERDSLLGRLLECAAFKGVGEELGRLASVAALSVPRPAAPSEVLPPRMGPLTEVLPEELRSAYLRAVTPPVVPRVDLSHVSVTPLSVEERAARLLEELSEEGRARFAALVLGSPTAEIVVTFLAALQLHKASLVDLEQDSAAHDLWIVRKEGGLPLRRGAEGRPRSSEDHGSGW